MPDRLAALSAPASHNDNSAHAPSHSMYFEFEEWDETVVDFGETEQLTITQTDELGVTHTVILPLEMIEELKAPFLQWLTARI